MMKVPDELNGARITVVHAAEMVSMHPAAFPPSRSTRGLSEAEQDRQGQALL